MVNQLRTGTRCGAVKRGGTGPSGGRGGVARPREKKRKRRRADSNRRIMDLQSIALATWPRRLITESRSADRLCRSCVSNRLGRNVSWVNGGNASGRQKSPLAADVPVMLMVSANADGWLQSVCNRFVFFSATKSLPLQRRHVNDHRRRLQLTAQPRRQIACAIVAVPRGRLSMAIAPRMAITPRMAIAPPIPGYRSRYFTDPA